MNDEVRTIIPWTRDLESMYRDIFALKIVKPWRGETTGGSDE